MNGTPCTLSAVPAVLLAVRFADAAQMNIRVFQINDHLLSFYHGRPAETTTPAGDRNWADFGALNVGLEPCSQFPQLFVTLVQLPQKCARLPAP